MGSSGFYLVAASIDDNLDYLHKQRWEQRAAELHDAEDRASEDGREQARQARQALREHYADRFKPGTSRAALLEQAAANYMARHPRATHL